MDQLWAIYGRWRASLKKVCIFLPSLYIHYVCCYFVSGCKLLLLCLIPLLYVIVRCQIFFCCEIYWFYSSFNLICCQYETSYTIRLTQIFSFWNWHGNISLLSFLLRKRKNERHVMFCVSQLHSGRYYIL